MTMTLLAAINVDAIFQGLIYLCVLVLIVWVALWVLAELSINLPPNVLKIVWIIVGLIAVWWLVKHILPALGLSV